jgi:hypothetical protein
MDLLINPSIESVKLDTHREKMLRGAGMRGGLEEKIRQGEAAKRGE